jgi:hypothetical protein
MGIGGDGVGKKFWVVVLELEGGESWDGGRKGASCKDRWADRERPMEEDGHCR